MIRIANNEEINKIKKNKKEVFLTKGFWLKKNLVSKPDVQKFISDQEIKKELKSYLEKLPLIYKEPLILHYLENRSYKEIGDILRISVGGVGARINRAKHLIRNIYEKEKK
ncbi:RNA polymerase sigma factor [bacterium]|nr:MAG: RNA polymerase sigma factor [bacterium]